MKIYKIEEEIRIKQNEKVIILEKGDRIRILNEQQWICFIDEEEFNDGDSSSTLTAYLVDDSVIPNEDDNKKISELEKKILSNKIKAKKTKKIKVHFDDDNMPSTKDAEVQFLYPEV